MLSGRMLCWMHFFFSFVYFVFFAFTLWMSWIPLSDTVIIDYLTHTINFSVSCPDWVVPNCGMLLYAVELSPSVRQLYSSWTAYCQMEKFRPPGTLFICSSLSEFPQGNLLSLFSSSAFSLSCFSSPHFKVYSKVFGCHQVLWLQDERCHVFFQLYG